MAKSLLKTIAKRLLALTSSDQRGAITSLTSITSVHKKHYNQLSTYINFLTR